MYPRLANTDLADPGDQVSSRQGAVSDNQPATSIVLNMGVFFNILNHLVFNRLLKHLPGSLSEKFLQSQLCTIHQLIGLLFWYKVIHERILSPCCHRDLGLEKISKRIRSFIVINNFRLYL